MKKLQLRSRQMVVACSAGLASGIFGGATGAASVGRLKLRVTVLPASTATAVWVMRV